MARMGIRHKQLNLTTFVMTAKETDGIQARNIPSYNVTFASSRVRLLMLFDRPSALIELNIHSEVQASA